MTPGNAPLFAEAVVRPQGAQKDAVDSALSKLLATSDPGGFIVDRLDRALGQQAKGFTYESDVAPWLGPRAGVFFETLTNRADGAAALAVTDAAAARQAIKKASSASKKPERNASYHGVGYTLSAGGTATGLVGDFLVTGSRKAFEDAVDASRGSSLADSSQFTAQLNAQPSDQLAFAYADPRGIVDALERSGQVTAAQVTSAGAGLQALLSQPVALSLSATADQLSLQASAATSSSTPAPQQSSLLGSFPGDSWLAFAASGAGSSYGQALTRGGSTAIRKALGFDLGSQLSRWAGDVGGFVRGTSLFGLGGALVLQTTDQQASGQTLSELQRALARRPSVRVSPLSAAGEQGFSLSLAGTPIPLDFVQRDGKVVVGLGSDSVDQVFSPSSTLSGSDAFKAATGALGGDYSPVSFIDFVPLFALVDSFPQTAGDPSYQAAKPYLDHLDYLILGAKPEGNRASVRAVLGLRQAASSAP